MNKSLALISCLAVYFFIFSAFSEVPKNSSAVPRSNKTSIAISVVAEPSEDKQKIEQALKNELSKNNKVEITSESFKASNVLWVYASKAVGSNKNPNGYSLAIVHTAPYLVFGMMNFQEKLCKDKSSFNEESKKTFTYMLATLAMQNQPVTYINVISTDDLAPKALDSISKSIAAEFLKRVVK